MGAATTWLVFVGAVDCCWANDVDVAIVVDVAELLGINEGGVLPVDGSAARTVADSSLGVPNPFGLLLLALDLADNTTTNDDDRTDIRFLEPQSCSSVGTKAAALAAHSNKQTSK